MLSRNRDFALSIIFDKKSYFINLIHRHPCEVDLKEHAIRRQIKAVPVFGLLLNKVLILRKLQSLKLLRKKF